jgi:hypothetical protein
MMYGKKNASKVMPKSAKKMSPAMQKKMMMMKKMKGKKK